MIEKFRIIFGFYFVIPFFFFLLLSFFVPSFYDWESLLCHICEIIITVWIKCEIEDKRKYIFFFFFFRTRWKL